MKAVSLHIQRSLAALFREDFRRGETTQAYLDRAISGETRRIPLPPGKLWFCEHQMSSLAEVLSDRRLTTVFRVMLDEMPLGSRAVVVDGNAHLPDGIFLVSAVEGDPARELRALLGCAPSLRTAMRSLGGNDRYVFATPLTSFFR